MTTGETLRAWRHGHGYTSAQAGSLWGVCGASVRKWEHGANAIPPRVTAHLRAHPVPPDCPDYPPTPEGLARAISRWPSQIAWCRWWGPTSGRGPTAYPSLHRWLHGQARIPHTIQAWLRAGAPFAWRGRAAPTRTGRPKAVVGRTVRRVIPPGVYTDWIPIGIGRLAPPKGYCDPERDGLQLPGCAWCCYRDDCRDIRGQTA